MADVDLITAEKTGEARKTFGILRVVTELKKRLLSLGVRLNEISFSRKRNSLFYYLTLLFVYPFFILQRKRSRIAHLTAETFAFLLLFPVFSGQRTIVTVHETHPFVHAEQLPFIKRLIVELNLLGLRRADHLVSVSGFLKEELVSKLGFPAAKITVIPNAVDHSEFKPLNAGADLRRKYSLPERTPIILYVGSEEPRKNMRTLVKALAILRKKRVDFTFVKIGAASWPGGREDTGKLIEKYGLSASTQILDYVPEEDLAKFYNAAAVCAYPCEYAGFGLPLVEAMSCGCAVVAADAAGIPEVVGNAGLLVPSHDAEGFADAIRSLLVSGRLRAKYRRLGIKQAQKFDWESSARKLKELYVRMTG